ncbi:MAG TPA: VOC family protein [Acidimicrobiales bacterium]|jgi:2,3-dihydroxybiphenyl 1,2-dioxygenase|nr:VOC family protein [Acidimicrobiales bacterium]
MQLRGLGYIGIGSNRLDEWREFLDAMGVAASAGPLTAPQEDGQDACWFKLDEWSWRIAVHRGDAETVTYAGWEVAGRARFEAAVDHLQRSGVKVQEGSQAVRSMRGVADVAQFEDPFGNAHEIFYGPLIDEEPPNFPHAGTGFLTGDVGLGHVLYVVPSAAEAVDFYTRVMGLRVTDQFAWGPNAAVFMRANARHHSLAFIDLPLPGGPGLNHFMIEARSLTDVGRAYDRSMNAKLNIVNSLGQHSNDPMLSFYTQSPSGFNVELGWNGLMVDENTWSVRTYAGRGEIWGHRGVFMDSVADSKAG